MVKGTRVIIGSEAKNYVDMIDGFRRVLHL